MGGSGPQWRFNKRARSKSPRRPRSKSPSKWVTRKELPAVIMRTVNKKAETKHFFHEFKSVVADEVGAVYHLTKIDDGVLKDERVGAQVMITGVDMGAFFNSDHTAESSLCRVIIFRANESLTSTPTPSEILTTVGDQRIPVSLYNVNNTAIGYNGGNRTKPRFTVYFDKLVGMSDEGSSLTKVPLKANIRLPTPLPCEFTGPEDTDEAAGQWYMLYCSSQPTGNVTVQLNADVRIYYTDV